MNNTESSVVLVDDEDNDNNEGDIEFVEVNCDDAEQPTSSGSEKPDLSQKETSSSELTGYTKPSYSYSQLITQALAVCPDMRATAFQICEIIANKQPYFKHHKGIWKVSIYSVLTKRKKFFNIVGSTDNGEYVWSFNPTFQKYMLDKWVPKYIKNKSLSNFNENFVSSNSLTSQTSVITRTDNLETQSPIIVSCESLKSNSDLNPESQSGPEFALADPNQMVDANSSSEQTNQVLEPEITVSECASDPETERAVSAITGKQEEGGIISTENKKDIVRDFTLDNLHFKHIITNDEINYRLQFHKEHPKIQKFRLHCTVCDVHLGTSGTEARRNIRLHANLGVLTCNTCYERTNAVRPITSQICHWCFYQRKTFVCSLCPSKFCEVCVKRNFGTIWCNRISQKDDWQCFLCDTSQIWPHRAIAYFLFRHYGDLKKKKNQLIKASGNYQTDLSFFMNDLTACCKSTIMTYEEVPTISSSLSSAPLLKHYQPTSKVSNLPRPILPKPNDSSPLLMTMLTDCNGKPNTKPEGHSSLIMQTLTTACNERPNNDSSSYSSSQQQMYFVDKPSNNIYVQSTLSSPSLPLNSGTQYVQNVYHGKNYLTVLPENRNKSLTSAYVPTISNAVSSCVQTFTNPPIISSTIPVVSSGIIQILPSAMPCTSVDISHSQSESSYKESTQLQPLIYSKMFESHKPVDVPVSLTELSHKEPVPLQSLSFPSERTNILTATHNNLSPISTPSTNLPITTALETSQQNLHFLPSGGIITNIVDNSNSLIVPDEELTSISNPESLKTVEILSLKERIERRPMPKSRKQSLLRSVLMNESIESMKKHLSGSDSNTTSDSQDTSVPSVSDQTQTESLNSQCISTTPQPQETSIVKSKLDEPILKSIIIQTVKECLQKKQDSSGFDDITIENKTSLVPTNNVVECIDLCNDSQSNELDSSTVTARIIPKIKIKTLEELQDPRKFDNTEMLCKERNEAQNNEAKKEPDTTGCIDIDTDNQPKEIDVTGLKRGIIEASRTLINTQKKFKELAKVISSNLSYQTDQAIDLISKFQDILKSCRKQIDTIDTNVKNQYEHLTPSYNIDSILESIRISSEETCPNVSSNKLKKQKIKKSKIHPRKKVHHKTTVDRCSELNYASDESGTGESISLHQDNVTEGGISNFKSRRPVIKKRDIVHFNPLEKRTILGSPEITEEDLQQIPDSTWDSTLITCTTGNDFPPGKISHTNKVPKQINALKKYYKKKEIWACKKRKKRLSNSNRISLKVNKDGTIQKRRGRPPKLDDFNTQMVREKLRKRVQPKPLRSSDRMHPSSVEYAARLSHHEPSTIISYLPVNYVIKPCSVLVHRLDPRVVELLQKRVQEL